VDARAGGGDRRRARRGGAAGRQHPPGETPVLEAFRLLRAHDRPGADPRPPPPARGRRCRARPTAAAARRGAAPGRGDTQV
jgi:hypothetical protein